AQQSALPATQALSELDFREKQAEARAVVAATQQAAGEKPSYDIGEQARVIQQIELKERPKAELAALETSHQVQLAQAAQQGDQIQRQLNALPDQRDLQGVQRAEIPLTAAERDIQAGADAVTRGLQASELANAPALITAQSMLLDAKLTEISASLKIANLQAQAANMAVVTNVVNVAANTQVDQDLLDRITGAASAGTLDAILKAQNTAA